MVALLITDLCSVSMVGQSTTCPNTLSSVVPNSVVPLNYSNTVGSSIILSCVNGYVPSNGGIINVTCVTLTSNFTNIWVASAQCSCMD